MKENLILERTHRVHLKPGGEICNRLSRGTRVVAVQKNGEWVKVNWRNGKKKGWIHIACDL
ncbi:MAG: hypothetical protein JSU88_05615 [Nitrospinaceae bacterium]|jgi:hypothetical protein|nr:MAG: hypothetical protein JSU88_05615 [Nitrospinaceae bacterium]